MLLEHLNDSQSLSKSEQGLAPSSEDWRLVRLKLALARLDDVLEETERFSDGQRARGERCWVDML
jgi:hypothetical protein